MASNNVGKSAFRFNEIKVSSKENIYISVFFTIAYHGPLLQLSLHWLLLLMPLQDV